MKLMWTMFVGALLSFALTAVEIEAEAEIISDANAVIVKSEKASGGKTVRFKGSAVRPKTMTAPQEGEEPVLTLKTTFAKAGKYTITAVVFTANTSSDSVFWAMDGDKPKDIHFGFPKTGFAAKIFTGTISEGEHLFKFWTREPGCEIDKLIIEEAK